MHVTMGGLQAAWNTGKSQLAEADAVARLWNQDPSLWTEDPETAAKVSNRLGWLSSLDAVDVAALEPFVSEVTEVGFRQVLLLGMGGSSLCPEVLRECFGVGDGGLDLRVLDSTTPGSVRAARDWADAHKTLFLVASKSGTTAEVLSFERFFLDHCGDPSCFVAITDPQTELERRAREGNWRRVFLNPADIGGRFSALSYFGLVPAALLGIDASRLIGGARAMMDACRPTADTEQNPGLELGLMLAEAARAGRDKLSLVFSPRIEALGNWVEQLIAESTGKRGMGVLPVLADPLEPARWGEDRVCVVTTLAGETETQEMVESIRTQGIPLVEIVLDDVHDLGGEFFRWEVATAICGARMGINPFDEPNVTESKDRTRALLAGYEENGNLPPMDAFLEEGPLRFVTPDGSGLPSDSASSLLGAHLGRASAGDYVAILAYLPSGGEVDARLDSIRRRVAEITGCPTTLGIGPRFLHSTGQLHKGGSDQGLFLQITTDDTQAVPIPGAVYDFGTLVEAQARGDWGALADRGRRMLRCTCRGEPVDALRALEAALGS